MKKLPALYVSILMTSSALVYAGTGHDNNSMDMNGMQNGKMQGGSMPMNGGKGMSPEMMQQRQAEVKKIMQEPDLAKRQAAMNAHKAKMQGKMASMMVGKGMKMSPQMMQRRQAMQAEMNTITNEPDAAKRQSMLDQHMQKMQGMMGNMPMSMNENNMTNDHSDDHKH